MAQAEVIGTVEHAAVGIAAAIDEVLARFFGSGDVHDRAVEFAGNQRFRRFRAEVAEEDDEGIAAGIFGFLYGSQHVTFVLNGLRHFVERAVFLGVGFCDGMAPVLGKRDDEAVTADREDTAFEIRDVVHVHDDALLLIDYSLNREIISHCVHEHTSYDATISFVT